MTDLLRRQEATEKTIARFKGKVFDWRAGITCVHLARFHLRNMGHKVPTLPRFRSALAARRALKAGGWESVEDMLDSILPRRPAPSFMTLGDLATVPGTDGLHSILVCAGPFKLLGWHPVDGTFVVYDGGNTEVSGAWQT